MYIANLIKVGNLGAKYSGKNYSRIACYVDRQHNIQILFLNHFTHLDQRIFKECYVWSIAKHIQWLWMYKDKNKKHAGDDHGCFFVWGREDVNVKLKLKWKYIMHKETLLR